MIEPVHNPEPAKTPKGRSGPEHEPVLVEDLAALLRIPHLLRKVDRVLQRVREARVLPEDFPMLATTARDMSRGELGLRWEEPGLPMALFAGLAWGDKGHDPVWEVRVEALPGLDPDFLRKRGLHRLSAKRAESRFSEWDSFWYEDQVEEHYLVGASAACTRFMEEEDPDAMAAEYLAGALHALHASGALRTLLQAGRDAIQA